MSTDRNLLLGILALQLDFIDRDELVAAMHAWVLTKHRSLGELLVEKNAIDPPSLELLGALVEKHLSLHEHDARKSLNSVSSIRSVREDLEKIADVDVLTSLKHVFIQPKAGENQTIASTAEDHQLAGQRFRILRPHARGGLGEVHVARDLELQREVALKEIQARHAHHAESRSRFLLEAEITGGLEHPGIVPVYGLGTYGDGRPFYAMRFIRGDNLKQAIERFHGSVKPGTPSSSEIQGERLVEFHKLLGRFVDVCEAIAYAHSRGILHRDLKPGNIMLGKFGETLVVDWGLAKSMDQPQREPGASRSPEASEAPLRPSSSSSAETVTGQAIGTPKYMSPEQAAGQLDLLGPTSDVYSLGATLYHLLTGQPPFADRSVEAILTRVRKGEFASPRQVNTAVPSGLEAICIKAMALKQEDRYATARELANDVERWLADEPVSAWPEPWGNRARRWMGRHRTLISSATAVLVVSTVALVVGNFLLARANKELERAGEETKIALLKATKARQDAEKAQAEAESERKLKVQQLHYSDALLHNSLIREAAAHWHQGDFVALRAALDDCRQDWRGPEFGFLARQYGQTLQFVGEHAAGVASIALSSDGKRLFSGSNDKTIKVWDLERRKHILTLHEHTRGVTCVALSLDGKRLFSASNDESIKVWDLHTGTASLTLSGHEKEVTSLAVSPDGKRLYSGGWDETIKIWDLEAGREVLTLRGNNGAVTSLLLSSDGKRLFSGGVDSAIKVWDLEKNKVVLTLQGHTGGVSSLALSSDGRRLGSGSLDRTIRLWDLDTEKGSLVLRGHSGSVHSLAFSPDGKRLFSGSSDQTVKIWELAAGKETDTLRGHSGAVACLVVSVDGKRLISGSDDNTIKVWNLDASKAPFTLRGHAVQVTCLALSPDGKQLYSGNGNIAAGVGHGLRGRPLLPDELAIKVWDLQTGKERASLCGPMSGVVSLALSKDGTWLFAGHADGEIKAWNLEARQESFVLRGHTEEITSLTISDDGKQLFSGGKDQRIKAWNLETGKVLLTLHGHKMGITCLALSSDRKWLFSGSEDSTIKMWDLDTGKDVLAMLGHTDIVTSLALSSDGKQLFSGSGDKSIKVWDLATRKEPLTFLGHTDMITCLVLSADDKRLFSGSLDKGIKVWDLVARKEALTLRGHTEMVISLALSSNGKRLCSGSSDRTIKVWELDPD